MTGRKKLFTPLEKKGILSLSLIFFFRMFGLFLILPVFSVLASEELTGATPVLVGLALGGYGLTAALLQIPFGAWSDRIGRKPVLTIGLLLYVAGSILAALVTDIHWMIVARLLQGAGAVSAPIFALIADLTRPEVRARANAFLGGSVGMSFGIAMFLGPLLGASIGLSGIFWVIASMASAGLVLLWLVVPDSDHVPAKATQKLPVLVKEVLQIPALRTINLGALVCSMGLSATFFMLPLMLKANGWEKADWWKIYLTMLIAGALTMVPAAIFAEVKNKFREVMSLGVLVILSSFGLMAWARIEGSFPIFMVAVYLFFMGFNVFEPLFPSLVTRLTTEQTKGTASGVYNFSQFLGQFLGGVLAGLLYLNPLPFLPLALIFLTLIFLWRCLQFKNPQPRIKEEASLDQETQADPA